MKKAMIASLVAVLWLTSSNVLAQPPVIKLDLAKMEKQALTFSPERKAAKQAAKAAAAKAGSQSALLWPRLSLEGSARYITEVPEFEMDLPVPNMEPLVITMGDNLNYSIGLQLGWQLWDSFAIRGTVEALEQQADAKAEEVLVVEQDVLFKTRLAYLQTQLALEQTSIILESLHLVQAQDKDIQARARAGSSSRIDSLSSRIEVTERKKQLRTARAELANALRQLYYLTGQEQTEVIRLPLATTKQQLPRGIEAVSVWIELDSLEQTRQRLLPIPGKEAIQQHPSVQAILKNVNAADAMARSAASGYWPQLSVYAKSSVDYPNQVVLEEVWQNTAGAALSWTLWEQGRTHNQVKEQKANVQAAEQKKILMIHTLALVWEKAQDGLLQLNDEQQLNQKTESDAQALSRMVYDAYRAGRVKYLEVQSANLRVLQASTDRLVTEIQLLIQLALLQSLR